VLIRGTTKTTLTRSFGFRCGAADCTILEEFGIEFFGYLAFRHIGMEENDTETAIP